MVLSGLAINYLPPLPSPSLRRRQKFLKTAMSLPLMSGWTIELDLIKQLGLDQDPQPQLTDPHLDLSGLSNSGEVSVLTIYWEPFPF